MKESRLVKCLEHLNCRRGTRRRECLYFDRRPSLSHMSTSFSYTRTRSAKAMANYGLSTGLTAFNRKSAIHCKCPMHDSPTTACDERLSARCGCQDALSVLANARTCASKPEENLRSRARNTVARPTSVDDTEQAELVDES